MDLTPRNMQITVLVDASEGKRELQAVAASEKAVETAAVATQAAMAKLAQSMSGIPSKKTADDMSGLSKATTQTADAWARETAESIKASLGLKELQGRAEALEQSIAELHGGASSVESDMRGIAQGSVAAAQATSGLAAPVSKASGLFGDLGKQIQASVLGFVSAQAIIGTVQGAFHATVDFIKESVQAYAEQEAAVKRMTTALQAQGTATPRVIQDYQDMAAQFQRTTVNSDELINEMQALLVQVGDVMPRDMNKALTAATDLSSGLGIDLRAATLLVGKAFAGETGTLARYGIVIDDVKLKTEGASAVLDAIQSKFGGQAQAEVETYAGKLKQLGNAWNEVQEAVGKSIVDDPIVIGLLRQIHDEVVGIGDVAGKSTSTWTDWWTSVVGGQTALAAEVSLSTVLKLSQDVEASLARASKTVKPVALFQGGFGPLSEDTGKFLADYAKGMEAAAEADDAARKAADAHAKSLAALRAELSGTTAIKAAQDMLQALKGLPPVQTLTRDAQDRVNAVMVKAIDAYTAMGRVAPRAILEAAAATWDLEKALKALPIRDGIDGIKTLGQEIKVGVVPPAIQLVKVVDGLPAGFEHVGRVAVPTFAEVRVKIADTRTEIERTDDAVRRLETAFAKIAESTGGDLSDIARTVSVIAKGWNDAADAADAYARATSVSEKAAALAQGGAAIASASDPRGKTDAQTIGGSAAAGARLGAIAGPYGMAIGAIAGAMIGWWRSAHAEWKKVAKDISRDLGMDVDSISQELAQHIADLEKTISGGTGDQRRKWAIAISLPDIIAEQGGLTTDNLQRYENQARDLFEVIQRGGEAGAAATQTLNTLIGQFADQAEKSGGLWDKTFKGLIAQSKTLGINLEAVNTALNAQISSVAAGAGQFLSNATVSDQSGAGAVGDLIAGTFAAMRGQGATTGEALASLQPQIEALKKQLADTGFTGGEAFDTIARLSGIAANAISGKALAAVNGLSTALVGAQNSGFLTQSMFTGLTGEILKQRDAVLATGASSDDVNALMQVDLQRIWQLQQDFNYKVDDGTQALLDQAAASGLVGDKYRSAMERAAISLEKVANALGKVLGLTGDVSDAINDIPTSKTIDIDVNYRDVYQDSGEDDNGRRYGNDPAQYAARGGMIKPLYLADGGISWKDYAATEAQHAWGAKGTDTVPAWLTPGEVVLNAAQQSNVADKLRLADRYTPPSRESTKTVEIHVHNNIQAIDAKGVKEFVDSKTFSDALNRSMLSNSLDLRTTIRRVAR